MTLEAKNGSVYAYIVKGWGNGTIALARTSWPRAFGFWERGIDWVESWGD